MNKAAVQRHQEWAREVRIRSRKASFGRIQGENGRDGRLGRRREHRDLTRRGSSTQEAAGDGAGHRARQGQRSRREHAGELDDEGPWSRAREEEKREAARGIGMAMAPWGKCRGRAQHDSSTAAAAGLQRGDPWIGTRGAALLSPCLSLTVQAQEGGRDRWGRVVSGAGAECVRCCGREENGEMGIGPGRGLGLGGEELGLGGRPREGKWPEACRLDGPRWNPVRLGSLYSLLLAK
uniref:Uncharacterized protein n=1 Tax=Triticum aestivum TaxID=4565 RepID=A0A3B6KIC2_WHEAT